MMTKMKNNSHYQHKQTAKEYESYYETKYKRADLQEKRLLTELLGQFKDAKNLLEVGCGTGHFTKWMESSFGLECYGVDISNAMLKEAKERWAQGSVLQSEGSILPLRDRSVDIVAYVTSLEYMRNAVEAFLEGARVAKKGIILGLMNKYSPTTLRKKFQAKTQKRSFYQEATFYSVSDIKKALDKALPGKYIIASWKTTVFPKVFGGLESSIFPFGAFLGVAVELRDAND